MGVMRKIKRMSITKKRQVLLQLANRQRSEKLKKDILKMSDEEINKCFMELLGNFTKEGSVKNV